MSSSLTLLEFVEEHIASKTEFRRYLDVANHYVPHDLYTIFNFKKVLEEASPEIREKYELERLFVERIKDAMASRSWVVTARWCNGGPFKELHWREWERANIDILNNCCGSFLGRNLNNGYMDIAIEPDQASLLRWRSQAGKRDVDLAIKSWLADYAGKSEEAITCKTAFIRCQEDLAPRVPKNAISETRFRKLFSKNLPLHLRYNGRPPGNKLSI